MSAAGKPAPASTRCYQRRRPEHTLWYRAPHQTHFETWLAFFAWHRDEAAPVYGQQAFRLCLECGIQSHGFARAHCCGCGHDILFGFSYAERGVPFTHYPTHGRDGLGSSIRLFDQIVQPPQHRKPFPSSIQCANNHFQAIVYWQPADA